jgi:hypothetical protein
VGVWPTIHDIRGDSFTDIHRKGKTFLAISLAADDHLA